MSTTLPKNQRCSWTKVSRTNSLFMFLIYYTLTILVDGEYRSKCTDDTCEDVDTDEGPPPKAIKKREAVEVKPNEKPTPINAPPVSSPLSNEHFVNVLPGHMMNFPGLPNWSNLPMDPRFTSLYEAARAAALYQMFGFPMQPSAPADVAMNLSPARPLS